MRQLLSPWNVFWMPFGIDTELRTSSWRSSCIITHFHCFCVDICLDVVVLQLVTSLMVLPPRVMIWKIIKRNAFNWRSQVLYKSCLLGFAAHWWSLHVPAVLGPSRSSLQDAALLCEIPGTLSLPKGLCIPGRAWWRQIQARMWNPEMPQ